MTIAEKAVETRRRNKRLQEEKYSRACREREAIRKGCLEVLESEDMSPDQKLEASKVLLKIASSTPYDFYK